MRRLLILAAAALALAACHRETRPVRLGTTTSVQDSGLLPILLAAYTEATGARVDVIAVGTGAAFQLARDGNIDLLLVHDRAGEEAFVAGGDGRSRHDLMWNTFEVLGPTVDPATVRAAENGAEALRRIGAASAPFVSRGDDSGTHRRERKLWAAVGGRPDWPGYRESGQGMGATLRIADETGAYVLCDRGTRLGYQGALRLVPLLADTADLRNDYSVVVIDPVRHPELDHDGARRLAEWLLSPAAAHVIDGYQIGGQRLFHPVHATS